MSLRALLDDATVPDVILTDLVLDSRDAKPGSAFVAVPGTAQDGRQFIASAIDKGATAVLAEAGPEVLDSDKRVIAVPGLKSRLGVIADRFYGSPSKDLTLIAVTGTNGKTSVVDLTAQMLRKTSGKTGSIGTLGMRTDQQPLEARNTTPDCFVLQRQLRDWREQGVRYVTLEASSHALDQGRLRSLHIDVAVFTNLSRDHLDYHRSMARYREAKLRLFEEFEPAVRIFNADDPSVAGQSAVSRDGGIGISANSQGAQVCFIVRRIAPLALHVQTPWGEGDINTTLLGRFNAFNLTAALTTVLSLGVPITEALAAAESVQAVRGRLQSVDVETDINVLIDYAHTPDALERALESLLESDRSGQIWVLFGCGGDRDRGKRAEMGAVACRLADHVVVTSDNPRSESPEAIIEDILQGCVDQSPHVEVDRARAIALVVSRAKAGDTVLIAGKGHEVYQEVDGVRLSFDDAHHAAEQLMLRSAA